MPDPIKTPDDLVKEFKKSGEFDRLRRELLSQFQNGEGAEAFWVRVDDIARGRLDAAEDNKLHLKAADTLHRELLQELDRFPLVERAVADVPALADPDFVSGIRKHAESLVLLRRSRSRGDTVEEDTLRVRVNGARDGQQRNGASHDEVGQRDEGMEISDG